MAYAIINQDIINNVLEGEEHIPLSTDALREHSIIGICDSIMIENINNLNSKTLNVRNKGIVEINGCNSNERDAIKITQPYKVKIKGSTLGLIDIKQGLLISIDSTIRNIEVTNSIIGKLWISKTIVKSGILISYGTTINEIAIRDSVIINNFKNKINELEGLKVNDITDIFIEDDLETIARKNFEIKDSLIINNNYSLVEDLPDKEKIIISGDGTESNPYATRDYPNYYEQGDFINDKYKEWNFKKYHRERNCMMCGTYYSTDYNNGSETNILREDI